MTDIENSQIPAQDEAARSWRRHARLLTGAGAVALSCVALANPFHANDAAAQTPHIANNTPQCSEPAYLSQNIARLHVTGNQILNGDNKPFTPYGISIFGGLQDGDHDKNWEPALGSSTAQIKAAPFWHANTVRIQIAEGNVFDDTTKGSPYNVEFLKALCSQVRLARSQGEQVIINDQTEFPDWDERSMTPRTARLWYLLGKIYGNQPGIIFDLFNEERLNFKNAPANDYDKTLRAAIDPGQVATAAVRAEAASKLPPIDHNWVWHIWRRGGTVGGAQFIGMQSLVNQIRSRGINNLILLEGPLFDDDLSLAGTYKINGKNLAWEIHHPRLDSTSDWDQSFGYLTKTQPVVNAEWSQFASTTAECRPNAYTMVPVYLRYLRQHNIGVLGWSLQAGSMVAEPSVREANDVHTSHIHPTNITYSYEPTNPLALIKPSHILPDYACDEKRVGEGAGQDLLNQFEAYSGK